MKVDLERIEAEGPERYKVLVSEDVEASGVLAGTVIGIVTRTTETTWAFGPRKGDDDSFDSSVLLSLTAKDVDELKAAIQTRFGLLDIEADRLLDDTLEAFASNVLSPISSLATKTSSIAGLVKALAHHVAMIAAADVREDKREEFFSTFMDRVREEAADLIKQRERRVAMHLAVTAVLKAKGAEVLNALRGVNDDDPVKH